MRKIVFILAPLFMMIFMFFTTINDGGHDKKSGPPLTEPRGGRLVTTAEIDLEKSVKGEKLEKLETLDLNSKIKNHHRFYEHEATQLVTQVYNNLPTKEQAKLLSEDQTHDTPEIIWQAADQLAKVAGYLDQHPESKEVINHFYRRCAETKEFLNSVRELCHQHIVGV